MGEGKEVKVEETKIVNTKKQEEKQEKKGHHVLRIIGMILFIVVAIYVGNVIRNFYILNTHMVATNEYSTKDNYKETRITYKGNEPYVTMIGYKKGNKTLVNVEAKQKHTTIAYYDKQTQESIVKFSVDENKVALVKQSEWPPVPSIAEIKPFGGLSAWQNFLMSLCSIITSEKYAGKDCYKINICGYEEIWVDKETGLVVRQSSGYFVGDETTTNERCYHDYTYEFGTVTDKDVAKPDLTGYKIQRN